MVSDFALLSGHTLYGPLWNSIFHQLYKMATHELRTLRVQYSIGRFLTQEGRNTPSEFATPRSDSSRIGMKEDHFYIFLSVRAVFRRENGMIDAEELNYRTGSSISWQ